MNHAVPNWIERLLGISAGAGEGAAWGIEYAWPWPPWATLLFAALAAMFVVAIYLRQRRGVSRRYRLMLAAVRLGLIALVLLMIAQVTLSLRRTGLPCAAVLVDDSLSMTIVDHYGDKPRQAIEARLKRSGLGGAELSRWNLARTLLTENDGALLRGIAEGHKLRVYFLTGVRPCRQQDVPGVVEEIRSLAPQGETTRLGGGMRAVLDQLRGTSPAAIIVLSDGINTDGPSLADAAEYARRRGVPLFFIGTGSDQPVRDLKLSDLMVDDVVFVDDVVPFECRLTASGFEGRKVSVALREKDKPDVLAKVQTTAGPDGQPQQVRLSYRPTKVGQFEYVVEVGAAGRRAADGEQPARAHRPGPQGEDPRPAGPGVSQLRVPLSAKHAPARRNDLAAAPSCKTPTWNTPNRTPRRCGPSRCGATNCSPTTSSSWATRIRRCSSAAALQNLADFVDQPAKGGALVLIAGPSFMPAAYRNTPLARLLPFSAEGARYPNPADAVTKSFVVQPTDLGLADPAMQLGDTPEETAAIWRNLAPLDWLLELPALKPGVRVLAEHPTRVGPDGRRLPVFCFQYVGAGKVLFHATDETWRWRYRVGDVFFARYWMQTIRYLCRSKLADAGRAATLLTDRREYVQGESVRLRVRFADERLAPAEDDGVTLVVEQSGRQDRAHPTPPHGGRPRRFRGRARPPRAGKLSRLDRRAGVGRAVAGGRFHRGAAGRRVRPSAHGRGRDAPRRRAHRRPILHLRHGRPAARRPAARPSGAHRDAAARAAVEPLARAGAVPRSADRRMDLTKTAGNGIK